MSEKEKKIFETFAFIIPKISESDKNYLWGLGEGVRFQIERSGRDKAETSISEERLAVG